MILKLVNNAENYNGSNLSKLNKIIIIVLISFLPIKAQRKERPYFRNPIYLLLRYHYPTEYNSNNRVETLCNKTYIEIQMFLKQKETNEDIDICFTANNENSMSTSSEHVCQLLDTLCKGEN